MNYSINFFLACLVLIISGCNNPTESSNEKLNITEDIDINVKDKKTPLKQKIEEEFKLTDENVIDFLFE